MKQFFSTRASGDTKPGNSSAVKRSIMEVIWLIGSVSLVAIILHLIPVSAEIGRYGMLIGVVTAAIFGGVLFLYYRWKPTSGLCNFMIVFMLAVISCAGVASIAFA